MSWHIFTLWLWACGAQWKRDWSELFLTYDRLFPSSSSTTMLFSQAHQQQEREDHLLLSNICLLPFLQQSLHPQSSSENHEQVFSLFLLVICLTFSSSSDSEISFVFPTSAECNGGKLLLLGVGDVQCLCDVLQFSNHCWKAGGACSYQFLHFDHLLQKVMAFPSL